MAICTLYIYIYTLSMYKIIFSGRVIRYIVGVLINHDAWDCLVEILPICNQLKFNTCKGKVPCMLINP